MTLKAFCDGTFTVAAENAEQATHVLLDLREDGNGPWEERPTDEAITVHLDDGRGTVTQTIAAWLAEAAGKPQVICSTEW